MPDVLSGLDKAGVCAYVNIMTYLGDPCNTHSFSSVTFGFVLSWLRKTPSGRLITALWSDLNSLLIIGSLVQCFGTNVSLFLILISSFVKKLLRFCIWPSNSNYCLTGPVWSNRWSESLQGNGPWVGQHFKNPFLALRFLSQSCFPWRHAGISSVLPMGNAGVKGYFFTEEFVYICTWSLWMCI